MRKPPDPYLRTQPWKIYAVFAPIERMLHQLETDGSVNVQGAQIVFTEHDHDGYYDLVEALRGLIEFHELATEKTGTPASVAALTKFANKLHLGAPIFEADIAAVRADIASCKRQAGGLRVREAADMVRTVQIRMRIDAINPPPS
jgi:hypothetical protein